MEDFRSFSYDQKLPIVIAKTNESLNCNGVFDGGSKSDPRGIVSSIREEIMIFYGIRRGIRRSTF